MRLNGATRQLFEALQDIPVIDAHEHLPPERERLKHAIDLPVLFAETYAGGDLISAGMPEQTRRDIADTTIPLEVRWKLLSPYLARIRYGSYARCVYLSVKAFYGFDDINEGNYAAISKAMIEANRPGIYHRLLRDTCHIEKVLTQAFTTDYDLALLVPLMAVLGGWPSWADVYSREQVEEKARELNRTVRTLDDYVELVRERIERWKTEGIVGVKIGTRPYGDADRGSAVALFDRMMRDPGFEIPQDFAYPNPIRAYLLGEILEACADLDLVVTIHTGMWSPGWYPQYARLLIPILTQHPRTRFDLYHMGMPEVREMGMIGKNHPNVWLNLCWSHIISPRMAVSALDEWLDLVPVNKIVGFGGDLGVRGLECICGHLIMAKENIARVLGGRVDDGLMGMSEAIEIAQDWFYDVPKELYKL